MTQTGIPLFTHGGVSLELVLARKFATDVAECLVKLATRGKITPAEQCTNLLSLAVSGIKEFGKCVSSCSLWN